MDHVLVTWSRSVIDNCSIVQPRGELTMLTYRQVSDDLVKFAVDQPRAVIVSLADLIVPTGPLLTAFTSAWLRVDTWPAVPLLLVAPARGQRDRLRAAMVDRFVPVFATVPAAIAGLAQQPTRRRRSTDLARTPACGRQARRFVTETCERWAVPAAGSPAGLIATELVENSLIHADSTDDIGLRLELRRGVLTVAVSDTDFREPVLRDRSPDSYRIGGLRLVSGFSQAWGSSPRWPHGKIVWATLRVDRSPN
ncbi:ATP-binding protein [Nocardia blacklockiae]|uniref:ATP-binding protein n=1 Tax=Nocardia blacklockiae TaxID=480036 RepID=UPI0018954C67|nr:ATP-binding protein [Nocardia blacklockiae]MBF6175813.1 ATP-binding protein [Nocardia blacklockiae]